MDYFGNTLDNNNDITRILYRIFDGKKVGSSMLRKIFLTNKYGETIKDMEQDVAKMGTSIDTAQNHYVKNES